MPFQIHSSNLCTFIIRHWHILKNSSKNFAQMRYSFREIDRITCKFIQFISINRFKVMIYDIRISFFHVISPRHSLENHTKLLFLENIHLNYCILINFQVIWSITCLELPKCDQRHYIFEVNLEKSWI